MQTMSRATRSTAARPPSPAWQAWTPALAQISPPPSPRSIRGPRARSLSTRSSLLMRRATNRRRFPALPMWVCFPFAASPSSRPTPRRRYCPGSRPPAASLMATISCRRCSGLPERIDSHPGPQRSLTPIPAYTGGERRYTVKLSAARTAASAVLTLPIGITHARRCRRDKTRPDEHASCHSPQ